MPRINLTSVFVDDQDMGPVTTAILDDTCGNLIHLATMTNAG